MNPDYKRDFDRVLSRSVEDRMTARPARRGTVSDEQLAARRREIEGWIAEQERNEADGGFDWDLGRRIHAAKRDFSTDSRGSDLHHAGWCRLRGCAEPVCIDPRATLLPTGSKPKPSTASHPSNGHSTTGAATNGLSTDGNGTNGSATNGHDTNGSATNGHATNGSSERDEHDTIVPAHRVESTTEWGNFDSGSRRWWRSRRN